MGEIEILAYRFRQGVEIAKDYGLFKEQPFVDFPNACCGDAPDLLAQYLIDSLEGNIRCRYVYGVYRYDDFENIFGHAWLEVNDGIIVDIAADQRQFWNEQIFPQNAFVPCYVGIKSQFHSMFEIEPLQCQNLYGLKQLGENSYRRLKPIYDIIIKNID